SNTRIMIGVVTSERHKHLLASFMSNIFNAMTEFVKVVVIIDTSKNEQYQEKLRTYGFPVLHQQWYNRAADRIEKGRNKLRDIFLQGNYTHLLMLDSDILLPKGLILKYLAWDKDCVTGSYQIAQKINQPTTCIFADTKKLYTLLSIGLTEEPVKVWASGLGCMLIKRKVLQKIKFRNLITAQGTLEDMLFCKDIRSNKFELWADMSKLLPHFNVGWGDIIAKENLTIVNT
ncbi:MAG: hypothetical protein AABY22_21705, partial [Nanoarchaeota archaeon]